MPGTVASNSINRTTTVLLGFNFPFKHSAMKIDLSIEKLRHYYSTFTATYSQCTSSLFSKQHTHTHTHLSLSLSLSIVSVLYVYLYQYRMIDGEIPLKRTGHACPWRSSTTLDRGCNIWMLYVMLYVKMRSADCHLRYWQMKMATDWNHCRHVLHNDPLGLSRGC